MRFLSLHLPFLATDRLQRLPSPLRGGARGGGPRAFHNEPRSIAEGPLATAAKIGNAFRLVALDAAALALGLRPGMALADARAMHPRLDVRDADPAGERATRDALVDWCRCFTPLAAPDGDNGAMLDIAGAAHLFGGEAGLLHQIRTRLAAQGFATNLAVADTPAAAWALARYGKTFDRLAGDIDPIARAKIFAPLPLAALRLDTAQLTQLGQAGLRRIGDLLLRPRAPIAARFGKGVYERLDEALGRATSPITPRFESPPYIAERRFAEGLVLRDDIEATILALAYDLCGLLARHGEGARRLDVALYRVDGVVKHLEAGTSRPLRDPIAMARLFRERIEAAGEEGLDTGYGFDVVHLSARAAERLDALQPNWADTAEGGADVADLVDRLGARFGLERVTRLAAGDAHLPERAGVAVAAISSSAKRGRGTMRSMVEGAAAARFGSAGLSAFLPQTLQTAAPSTASQPSSRWLRKLASAGSPPPLRGGGCTLPDRPLRLFDHPEPIEAIAEVPDRPPARFTWRRITHHVVAIEGPERIAPNWWNGTDTATRDYFRAEDTNGRRFWLYREGLYRESAEPRWFLHGLFA